MSELEEEKSANYTGVIIAAALLPMWIFFTHIGKTDLGLSVGICLGMIILAVKLRWKLRRHFWFWAVIVVVLALHVPVVLAVKWPHGWVPGVALLPIGLADLAITLGAIQLVENIVAKFAPPDEET